MAHMMVWMFLLLPKASKEEGMSDAQAAEIAVGNLR